MNVKKENGDTSVDLIEFCHHSFLRVIPRQLADINSDRDDKMK
jgi:hypothetical protein